jgi:hypothetical protein
MLASGRAHRPAAHLLSLLVLLSAIVPGAARADGWCPAAADRDAPAARAVLREAEMRLFDPPRPLPVVRTEGLLPGQGGREESLVARRDLPRMRSFALAWWLTHDGRHAQALARYLDAWTSVYRISYSPIDETHFEAMVDAYAIAGEALPEATRRAAAEFLHSMAAGYIARMDRGRGERKDTWINNWQSHRVKIVTLIAVALDDPGLFADARRLYREQLAANIRKDGSVEDFHLRDALHYVVYDLEPLARAAMAAKLRGEDWLRAEGRNGSSLAQALDWLRPYAAGDKSHEEFARSRVRFDAERRAAGVKGFGGTWERGSARTLLWSAATLDARYLPLAKSLGAAPGWLQLCWKPQ